MSRRFPRADSFCQRQKEKHQKPNSNLQGIFNSQYSNLKKLPALAAKLIGAWGLELGASALRSKAKGSKLLIDSSAVAICCVVSAQVFGTRRRVSLQDRPRAVRHRSDRQQST